MVNYSDIVTDDDIDGPERDEVKEYEFKEDHPAADVLKEFGVDVAQKQTERSSKRYFRGMKTMVAWLDVEHDKQNPLEVTEDEIGDYLKWMVNTEWSRNARQSKFTSVKRFYRWAKSDGPLNENLAEDREIEEYTLGEGALEESRQSTDEDDDYKWVTRNKIVQLWHPDNIPSPRTRNELMFKLLWHTGTRTGELAEAKIESNDSPGDDPTHLDRENGRLKVPNLKRGGNQSDYRWVYYPRDRIEPLMTEWLDRGKRDALGPYGDESEYLFLTHQSDQMRPSHISRLVKEAAFNAGIQEVDAYDVNGNARWMITGHTVRHSAATYWANETGLSLHHIRKQLGHSKLDTTMKYVHDDPQARMREFNQVWE